EKERFVERYGIYSDFWKSQTSESRAEVEPYLKTYLDELARLHYAKAQSTKNATEFLKSAQYFRQFVEAFPADRSTSEKYFLLGEALTNAGDFASAVPAYETAAY